MICYMCMDMYFCMSTGTCLGSQYSVKHEAPLLMVWNMVCCSIVGTPKTT